MTLKPLLYGDPVTDDGKPASLELVEIIQRLVDQVGTNSTGIYTVATLPSASPAGRWAYVSDETGGAVMAFSDGTDWRRCTDRAVVS